MSYVLQNWYLIVDTIVYSKVLVNDYNFVIINKTIYENFVVKDWFCIV